MPRSKVSDAEHYSRGCCFAYRQSRGIICKVGSLVNIGRSIILPNKILSRIRKRGVWLALLTRSGKAAYFCTPDIPKAHAITKTWESVTVEAPLRISGSPDQNPKRPF